MSYAQILHLQERLRQDLVQLQADLDSPALREITRTLEEEQGSRVTEPLQRLRQVLAEVIHATEVSVKEVIEERDRSQGARAQAEAMGLPDGLAHFVAERSAFPGFSFETDHDPLRGRVLRWREVLAGGEVRAAGILYERPHAWVRE